MTANQPRLILVQGSTTLSPGQMQYLKSVFEVVEVENIAAARSAQKHEPNTIIAPELIGGKGLSSEAALAQDAIEHVAEGAGLVDTSGFITWSNQRLRRYSTEIQRRFARECQEALGIFNSNEEASATSDPRPSLRCAFEADEEYFEVAVSPASTNPEDEDTIDRVVGVLWNVTARHLLQAKIDAIDAAGTTLMRLEPSEVAKLNMAQRLTLVEERIIRYVHEVLDFDNFEIRLLNRETNQLELVISQGIAPLKVGEVMYADKTGHGISGYVGATGESYVCSDVRKDPLYREGLDNARSSLTVPLKLYDKVIGVFNAESYTPNVFNDEDRQFAEIFGRYIATAMNILDLLVVERYTTNAEITQNMLGELSKPLVEIASQAQALREAKSPKERREHLEQIVEAASGIKNRIEACTSGPRSILGAEEELRRLQPDPTMTGKRVLVAEDEDAIRETLYQMLCQKGCIVVACDSGDESIAILESTRHTREHFDLIITDIKLPGCNGYEIFHTAKDIDPDTPVILMTGFGYDPNHSIVRASQEGLHSFLFKPFKASQILDLVSKAFAPAEVK